MEEGYGVKGPEFAWQSMVAPGRGLSSSAWNWVIPLYGLVFDTVPSMSTMPFLPVLFPVPAVGLYHPLLFPVTR